MALAEAQILSYNPWWEDPVGWERGDAHLRDLARHPRPLPAELVGRMDLGAPAIHTVRGPRQVGKSTDLKLLVRRAIAEGFEPRRVAYLALDLIEGQPLGALAETIVRAKRLARGGGAMLVLLDEVTLVPNWQTAVKALWDDGTLREDIVICTGSSAVDLREGVAERLPGRRGAGRDYTVFPQSFASFARALYPNVPESPRLSLDQLVSAAGREAVADARIFEPRLQEALQRYLAFGGLPAAVAEAVAGEIEPSPETKRIVYDSLLKEAQRTGAGRPAAHALLERLTRSLGSKTSWSRLARETGLSLDAAPSKNTVRRHIESLAAAYLVLVLYFWRSDSGGSALSKDKKLYFGDLLLHTVAREYVPGLAIDEAALVENAVALALYHRYEPDPYRLEGFDAPTALHVWGTRRAGEIDFVCGPRGEIAAVEVKYQRSPDLRPAAAIPRAFPGRPVLIATRSTLEHRESYFLIPCSLLLWALG